ncbi:hypothetical protein [Martelella sp. AD-3]|uniref:hypothetical protein n=1 Tax=Martelella sp. AD-3 TaxID=686597 RepID=UPI0004676938|nr:hypothetical protein [Martelella sp. AD-3]AMM84804.1 hypothetical protein AZF01_10915 [Martelella sp. AD-3]
MIDYYLRFADHADALAVLEVAGVTVPAEEDEPAHLGYQDAGLPEGMLVLKSVGAACDGLVYAPTGETRTAGDGIAYPVMETVDGYHVNLRLTDGAVLPAELATFQVAPEPATPAERFA